MIKNSLLGVDLPDKIGTSGEGLSILICTAYKHWFNWMTFASWYSIYKNLPEAKVTITSPRAESIDTLFYNWIYKCSDIRFHLHKNIGDKLKLPYLNKLYGVYVALRQGLVKQPLIVLDADMMAVSDFLLPTVEKLNNTEFASSPCPYNLPFTSKGVGPVWYFNKQPMEKIEEAINTLRTVSGEEHLDLLALSKAFGDNVEIVDELGCDVRDTTTAVFAHYVNGCGSFLRNDWEKGKVLPPFHVAYSLFAVDMSVNEKKVLSLWSQMANSWDIVSQ